MSAAEKRTLTDADVEAIADALARKLKRTAPANDEPKPKRLTKAEIAARADARLKRRGVKW